MKPVIVMQSDFGIDSGLVACMHGMCKIVDRELETHDITHLLPAFDIKAASYCLQYTVPYWPSGTIFVSVVDPGVGTSRKASVAKLKNGSYVVTPDNGTLTYLNNMIGIEAICEIDESINRYNDTRDISVFHGRDLFSYCAAKLASGIITFKEVGPEYPVEDVVLHEVYQSEVTEGCAKAKVTGADPFGSIELSVLNKDFSKTGLKHGDMTNITITCEGEVVFNEDVLYEKSFGFVGKGERIIFNDLASFVTIACNEENFAETYNISKDKLYDVVVKKA
ncbi:MAG: SAM-dependent chlorinase/fluorinase [Terrisporobacter sp.]|uniref:SAM hydrolase/SAM-dependent halogenase family protein n=1 Tax=Terrisporobacter sp. TaxID=1965305 RepID=UPI002FC87DA7